MNSLNRMGIARVRAIYPHKNMAVVTHRMGQVYLVVFLNNQVGGLKPLDEGDFIVFDQVEVVYPEGQKMGRIKSFMLISDYLKSFREGYTVRTSESGRIVFKGSLDGLKKLAQRVDLDNFVITSK